MAQSENVMITELDKKNPFVTSLLVEDASTYSGLRSIASYRLGVGLLKELKEKELMEIYEDLDNKLIPILARMEYEGIHLNIEYMKELEEDIQEKIGTT